MWKIEKTDNRKYPYRISINKGDKTNFVIFSSKIWPEEEKTIFCVRSETKPDINILECLEEIPIASVRWLEQESKVSLVLERENNKKCNFRFVKKKYKDKDEEYEQIFFKSKPDEKTVSVWRVEETDSDKFPYHISIVEKDKLTLSLLSQDKWPGASGNIFCLRSDEKSDISHNKIIEEVPVVFVTRVGKRLSVLLDRPNRKRCEFLFVRKEYKNKDGDYEQIFFRTQQGIKQHRTRGNLSLQPKKNIDLEVVIDSNERYAWKFGEHNTSRKNLTVGDYALMIDNEIAAVVERKTFDNMLSDISKIQVLHQQLTELSVYSNTALIIEAQYGDFLTTEKIGKWSSVAHMGRALAELSVLHPKLPIIFAGNRKQANHWALRFFEAVLKKQNDPTNDAIAKAVAQTRTSKSSPAWLKVKNAILEEMPNEFSFADLKNHLASLTDHQIRSQLHKLKEENIIKNEGRGRTSKWIKVTNRLIEKASI